MTNMKLAVALQLLLFVYHQITTLFDLYPFNGARFSRLKERLAEAAFNGALMIWAPIVYIFGWRGVMPYAAMYYFVLFVCVIATWFVPYFFGGSEKWTEIYSRVQGRTLLLLPPRGDHPNPNIEHLVLMVLTLITGLVTLGAYRRLPNATLNGWPIMLAVGAVMVGGIAATHWRLPGRQAAKQS
jgi:hypothetical protein